MRRLQSNECYRERYVFRITKSGKGYIKSICLCLCWKSTYGVYLAITRDFDLNIFHQSLPQRLEYWETFIAQTKHHTNYLYTLNNNLPLPI